MFFTDLFLGTGVSCYGPNGRAPGGLQEEMLALKFGNQRWNGLEGMWVRDDDDDDDDANFVHDPNIHLGRVHSFAICFWRFISVREMGKLVLSFMTLATSIATCGSRRKLLAARPKYQGALVNSQKGGGSF